MDFNNIITELVLIFAGSALLATLFIFLKQPVIISYIVLGGIVGPFGFKLIKDARHLEHISQIGIILLLFLIGLNLHPNKLYALFRKTALITLGSSAVFAIFAGIVAFLFGFSPVNSLIIGATMVFSSTVIGLKLIPTTALHHRHIGEVMVSVLLFQDIMAIVMILLLNGSAQQGSIFSVVPLMLVKGAVLIAFALLFVRYCILPLFRRYDVIQEYIFIVALGWCMACAGIAHYANLSYEIGAFIAGFSLALSPISLVISEHLKPLREFFLILFFFAIGAQFDLNGVGSVLIPGILLSVVLLFLKPVVFNKAFLLTGERVDLSKELGVRLGQASEFSLLAAYTATTAGLLEGRATLLIQLTVIITFVASTYYVTYKYSTPISVDSKHRKD